MPPSIGVVPAALLLFAADAFASNRVKNQSVEEQRFLAVRDDRRLHELLHERARWTSNTASWTTMVVVSLVIACCLVGVAAGLCVILCRRKSRSTFVHY